ncbi:hypothetical protein AKO1_012172 [Acrasis kona]|uniref:Uncharacterized protein n=1 Tax=Acrasis kona TaxID=1008807 RepID=A0AAW2ZCY3_9EUKA
MRNRNDPVDIPTELSEDGSDIDADLGLITNNSSIQAPENISDTPTSTSYTTKQKTKQLNSHECLQNGAKKGAGKSSLLSTFHRTLFQNHGEDPIAGIGSKPTEAFTQKIKGYSLNKSNTIRGHDTRGLETLLKPEIEHVKAIRDGKVVDNSSIKQKERWGLWDYLYSVLSRNPAAILDPDCLRKDTATIQELPHAVIFVIPANQRHVPKELEDFVNLFCEYGYKPLFAVTKIDCHNSQQGDLYAATHLYDTKKEEIMDLFDCEFERVKPIQNYTQWDKREHAIENLALDLLQRAVKAAESYISNYEAQGGTLGAGDNNWCVIS